MPEIGNQVHQEEPVLALGNFVRAARERLTPEDFGFSRNSRRRAKGLRREEVAAVCGISTTWYTWIEQGRTTAISAATLAALAESLRLSKTERAYLFLLAEKVDPILPSARAVDAAPYGALVSTISAPAYVLDRCWNAIAWNPPAADLFHDWLGPVSNSSPDMSPNLLRYVFLNRRAPESIVDWAARAERLVAEYRADSASSLHDPEHMALVEELSQASEVFDRAWRAQKVLPREGGSRSFVLPLSGTSNFKQLTLRMALQSEIKLVVLLPQ